MPLKCSGNYFTLWAGKIVLASSRLRIASMRSSSVTMSVMQCVMSNSGLSIALADRYNFDAGVPVERVMHQIQRWVASQRIRGQDMNNEIYGDDLKKIGITKGPTTVQGNKVYHYRFPSSEGIEWKLKSMNWWREA